MKLIKSQIGNFHVSPKRASERNDNNTFQITQDLEFDQENTLIVAENGAGKSIIGMILLSPFMTEKEEVDGKSLNILANPYPGARATLPTIITEKYQKDAGAGYATIGLILNKATEDDSDFGLARYYFISTIPANEMEELHLTANEDGTASNFEDIKLKLKDLHKKYGAKFKYWPNGTEFRKALQSEGFNFDVQNYNIAINDKGEGNIADYFKKQNSSEKLIKEILVDAVAKKRSDAIADPVGEYFGFRKANDEVANKVRAYKKFQTAMTPVLESKDQANKISSTLNQAYAKQYGLYQAITAAIAESKLRLAQLQNENERKNEEAKKLQGLDLMQAYLKTDEEKAKTLEQKAETEAKQRSTEAEIAEASRHKFIYQLAERRADVDNKRKAFLDAENELKALQEKHTQDEQQREAKELGGKLSNYWESQKNRLTKENYDLDKLVSDESSAISKAEQEIQQERDKAAKLDGNINAQEKAESKQATEVQGLFERLPRDFQNWQPGLDGLIDNTEALKETAKEKREKAESNAKELEKKLASSKSNAEQLKRQQINLANDSKSHQKEIASLTEGLGQVAERRNKLAEIQMKLGLNLTNYDVQPTQMAIEEEQDRQNETVNKLKNKIKKIDEEAENLKSGLQLTKEAKEFLQETLGEDYYHTGEDFLSDVGEEKAENLKRNLPGISVAIVMEKNIIDKLASGKIVPAKPPVNFPIVLKDDALELANTASDKEISYVSGEGKLKLYAYADPELQTKEGREKRKELLDSQKQDCEERINRLKDSIENLRKLNYETAKITGISKEFEDGLREKLADEKSRLEQIGKLIESYKQQLNRTSQELEQAQEELEQAQEELDKAKEIEKIAGDIAKRNDDLRQTKNEIAGLSQEKTKISKKIQLKEAKLAEAQKAHGKNAEKLVATEKRLEEAKKKANAYIKYAKLPIGLENESFEAKLAEFESMLKTLENALKQKYADEEGLEKQLSKARNEEEAAKERLDDAEKAFEHAKVKDGLAEISDGDVNDKISALGGSLNFDVRKADEDRDRLEQDIRKLSKESGELDTDIKNIEKDVKKFDRNLRSLDKKIKSWPCQVNKTEVDMNRDYKADAQRTKEEAQKAKDDANKEDKKQMRLQTCLAKLGEVKKTVPEIPKIDHNDLNGLEDLATDIMKQIKHGKQEEKKQEKEVDRQLKDIQNDLNRLNKDEERISEILTTIQERINLQEKFAVLDSLEKQISRFLDENEEFISEANERRSHAITCLIAKAKMLINELKDAASGSKVKTDNGNKKLMEIKNLPEEITKQTGEGLLDRCYETYQQNQIYNEDKEDQKRWLESQLGWKSIYQNIVERAANGNIFVRLRLLNDDKFSTWETWQGASSGGQATTAAFVVLFTVVHYLAKTRNPADKSSMIEHSEFLVLDNPFAKVQSAGLIKTIYALAKAAEIQLICFTNIKMEAIMNISNKTYNFKSITTEDGFKTGENTRDFDVIKDNGEKSLEAITTFEQGEETTLF